jgi:hypothetical protein
MPMKLGKKAPKAHAKTLSFEKYAGDALPVAPPKTYWGYKVPVGAWGMLGNDVRGNCVVAMAMHMDMNWTAHTGTMRTYTTAQATELYDRLSPDDSGLVITDFLNLWQTTGMYDSKILGWASFNWAVPDRFNQVAWLFGGVATGVQFPHSAMDQFTAGQAWEVVPNDPIDGGHAIPFFNYGSLGRKCVTWGSLEPGLNDWISLYMDEGYAVISESWFDTTTGLAPSHFNRDLLWADLKKL